MASRLLLRQRAVVSAVAAAVAGTGIVFSSSRQLSAEEQPANLILNRKPIYDEKPLDTTIQTASTPSTPSETTPSENAPAGPYRPTPTDRLAVRISSARLALYRQATKAEDAVNNALTETLRLEHSFTGTIRSLAPPKHSGEKIFPGVLYVLVASMAGSIVTRNRNILLRATFPAAIGISAAYAVLPITVKNVGDLAWTYEERYPALADAHLRTKARLAKIWETGKAHSVTTVGMVQDKVGETRESLEGWVKKGR